MFRKKLGFIRSLSLIKESKGSRKICIVTGTRAEYGLLYWLMREVKDDPDLELQIVATGMHLSPEFGLTYQDIEADGFEIDETVEMLLSSDTSVGVAKSMGVGTIGFAEAFDRLAPDVIVVLGDRFEALSAAQAALVARIPIAHIHGGETTEGAVDEMIRHSVTKMAYLHFVATDTFRQRVIQLGEQPARVFTVGAPGLDYLRRLDLMSREELEESLDFELGEPTFLITYHPATLQNVSPDEAVEELLEALADFPEARFVFTKANADAGGHFINRRIERYVEEQAEQARLCDSLGQRRYLSALHHADVVIGNSSSGLIEAPAVPVPTVNVGDRQKGRPKAESVIDCPENSEEISRAIELALSEKLKKSIEGMSSPYGSGGAASRIRKHLRNVNISDLSKPFYDLEIIIG